MREGQVPDLALFDNCVGRAPEAAVRLVASNRQAEAINDEKLDAIPSGAYRIAGQAQGAFNDYAYDERTRELNREVVGRYAQLPILPGWAITVPRSQGMTIPNMHLDPRGIFAPGQLYVGLSRAPSLSGLSLERPVTEKHVLHDQRVRLFQAKLFGLPETAPDETGFQPDAGPGRPSQGPKGGADLPIRPLHLPRCR
jgi:hypothetical protein